ncbi:MAG: hypothetical protein ACRCR2_00975 [Fusobacteriaceae bacterium]
MIWKKQEFRIKDFNWNETGVYIKKIMICKKQEFRMRRFCLEEAGV